VLTLTKTDASYLAGLFDGEGCLTVVLQKGHRGKRTKGVLTPHLMFTIANTDRGVLQWCLDTIGTGIVVIGRGYSAKHPRRLPLYRYNLEANANLVTLLPRMIPYLKVKKERAILSMRFLELRSNRDRRAYTEEDVTILFNIRQANLRDYDLHGTPTLRYMGKSYTKDEFIELFFRDRDGSIYRHVDWTPEMDSVIGTDTDLNVAKLLGLKISMVQKRRVHLGIPSSMDLRPKKERVLQLRSEGLTLKEISSKIGISKSSVARVLDEVVY